METKDYRSNYDRQVDLAREIFLQYDQALLIRKFGLKADEAYLYLTYLNSDFRICRKKGQVDERLPEQGWKECRNFSSVMTIYDLLCFHRGETLPPPSGIRQTIGSFVIGGVQETDPFTREAALLFDRNLPKLETACPALGGILQPPSAGADVSCLFPVTDFFSVLLRFWAKDEDFPPSVSLLWDRNTLEYIHFETAFYLQGDLLERLSALLKRKNTSN